jgi:hypothetical protein
LKSRQIALVEVSRRKEAAAMALADVVPEEARPNERVNVEVYNLTASHQFNRRH